MKHLTDQQLSARLDRALTGAAHEDVERHLAGCAQCRDALAALAVQDKFLGAALVHDPGEEYFATFAARVEDRLRAEGQRGAQARLRDDSAPWFRWFQAPRRVAWIGAVATIVAGAAIVLVTTREDRMPRLHAPEVESRIAQTGPVPAPAETPPSDVVSPAPEVARQDQVSPSAESERSLAKQSAPATSRAKERDAMSQAPGPVRLEEGAAPARMREVGPAASAVPVMPEPQAAPPQQANEGQGVRVMKRNVAQPLQKDENLAAKSAEGFAATPPPAAGLVAGGSRPGEVQLCGHVIDVAGRPVVHASIALVTIGRTATSGEAGDFCLSAPDGSYELSVMAVGFQTSRMQVKVAGERADVRVTLQAISVLDGQVQSAPTARLDAGEPMPLTTTTSGAKNETKSDAKKQTSSSSTTAPAKAKPVDPFAGESKSGAAAATKAMDATRYASTYPTLPTWQKANDLWSIAAEAVKTPTGRGEALYRIAEAKVNVWRQYPTPTRKNDALAACSTILSGNPTTDQRKEAMRWMNEIRRGPTGRD